MRREWNLRVCNPSDYERAGFVIMPFQDLLNKVPIEPHRLRKLALHDQQGNPVSFQIDPIISPTLDPRNLSRAVLIFHVSQKLPPGPGDYSKHSGEIHVNLDAARQGKASKIETPMDDKLRIETVETNGSPSRVELINSQLVVSLNLRPSSDPDDPAGTWWYSGSATSVRLRGQEMLAPWDCFRWMGHDPEKRCMQIDHICVDAHPLETSTPQEFSLFDRPYELISKSSGPVRASVTLASESLHYSYDGSAAKRCHAQCQLFRVISLYANVDYVVEELFVQGTESDSTPFDLTFSARYFSCMDMGFNPCVYQSVNVPDWFAVGRPDGYLQERHPGYGFACDAHVYVPLANPHPHYHDSEKAHKTFSRRLQACQKTTCVHLFMHGTPAGFDSQIGHNWYEVIYKPLKARL